MLKWSILSFCEVKNQLILQILFDKNLNFHNKGSFKIFEFIKIIALELDLNHRKIIDMIIILIKNLITIMYCRAFLVNDFSVRMLSTI
jgi:hypothetical protein